MKEKHKDIVYEITRQYSVPELYNGLASTKNRHNEAETRIKNRLKRKKLKKSKK